MFEDDLEYYIDEFERRFADNGCFDHNLRLRDGTSYYVPLYEPDGVKQFIMLTRHDSSTGFDYVAGTILYMYDEDMFIYIRQDCRGEHIMSDFMKTGILKEVFPDLKSCTIADDGDKDMLAARIALAKMAGLKYTVVEHVSRFDYGGRESCYFTPDEMREHLVWIAEDHHIPFDYSECRTPEEVPDDVCRVLNYMTDDEIFKVMFTGDYELLWCMDELTSCFGKNYERIADKAACLANWHDAESRSEFEKQAVDIFKAVNRAEACVNDVRSALENARLHGFDFVRAIPERVLPGSSEAYRRCDAAENYLDRIGKRVRDLMEDYYAREILDKRDEDDAIDMSRDLERKAREEMQMQNIKEEQSL